MSFGCPTCDQDRMMVRPMTLQGFGLVGFGNLGEGKLTDEGGQGSTNDSYGKTVTVTTQEDMNFFMPPYTIADGAKMGNPGAILRVSNIVGVGVAGALFAFGFKKLAAVSLGLNVFDVVARQVLPNWDSASGALPFNAKVV